VNATALLALECPDVEPGRSSLELRQQHAMVLALRAAGPLDGGNMSRGYRLNFGHGNSRLEPNPLWNYKAVEGRIGQ